MHDPNRSYHPEWYWTEVAERMAGRKANTLLAGDDEPYYEYKRNKFLRLFHSIPFAGKKVLEIGPGPGGNLMEVLKHRPHELHGADISEEMIRLATKTLAGSPVTLTKVNGTHLPFPDQYFDITYTSTVLQHNTDENMLKELVAGISRVTGSDLYLFERIERTVKGDALCLGRPVSYYQNLLKDHNFRLQQVKYLHLQFSYLGCGSIRKLLNKKSRKEGEPLNKLSLILQRLILPLTKTLDNAIPVNRDLAMLHFKRV